MGPSVLPAAPSPSDAPEETSPEPGSAESRPHVLPPDPRPPTDPIAPAPVIHASLVVRTAPDSPAAIRFRLLRAHLRRRGDARLVGVRAADPHSDVAVAAANLALALGEGGHPVLLLGSGETGARVATLLGLSPVHMLPGRAVAASQLARLSGLGTIEVCLTAEGETIREPRDACGRPYDYVVVALSAFRADALPPVPLEVVVRVTGLADHVEIQAAD